MITQEEMLELKQKDLEMQGKPSKNFERISITDKECFFCGKKLMDIKLKQQGKYTHVIVCGHCLFWDYRWGV